MSKAKPYGANRAMTEWAETRGLRFSPAAHCLHWVSKGRCGVSNCSRDGGRYDFMDHTSGWIGNGERVLLCQPYLLTRQDMSDILAACEKFNLVAYIHGGGWYGMGAVAVELMPPVKV